MNDLFFARAQMGMSLAFHIIFAVIGMAMPLLMVVSEGCFVDQEFHLYGIEQAMGGGNDHSIRGWSGVWYGPFVRVGFALAEVYGICRSDHRYAIFSRRIRLLY